MEASEARYRALLLVSEAANAEIELGAVLEAATDQLNSVLRVDSVAAFVVREGAIWMKAIAAHGVERRPGESLLDALHRQGRLPGTVRKAIAEGYPIGGTGTERVSRTGRALLCARLEPDGKFPEDERLYALGIRSYVRAPMFARDRFLGSIAFARSEASPRGPVAPFTEEDRDFLEAVARPIAGAVAHALAFEEIARLKTLVENENVALREDLDAAALFGDVVGSSQAIRRVLAQVEKVAPTDSTVLVTGETGTGKELVARAIHRGSSRRERALVKVNCAALPPPLIASELFGHERGAFTGAVQRRLGRFELAAGGSIFLDEVAELPLETQSSLLRVLQEGEFERVGGGQTLRTNARVIAATNRDLTLETASGRFRRDLFYRLNVFPIEVPPLRQRREDIPVLVEYFASQHGARLGKGIRGVDRASLDRLVAYAWPGNIRELENVVERAMILAEGATLVVEASLLGRQETVPSGPALVKTLREAERDAVEAALVASGGQISGEGGAAALLGVPPSTLGSRIARLGLDKARYRNLKNRKPGAS